MSTATPFLTAISSTLPPELSESLKGFQTPAGAQALDALIRFVSGADASDPETQQQWSARQHEALAALSALTKSASSTNGKRQREQEDGSDSDAKRQKTDSPDSEDGPPLFTLHSISTSSPIRKKVDIAVHASSVRFLNAATRVLEASIPLAALTRAFLLPTRGKMKAHWTVVILSSDAPDRGKKQPASSQIIFGLDAAAAAAVKYTAAAEPTTTLKTGTPTRALLLDFLARLQRPVLEPVPAVFKSACAGVAASAAEGGVPGVQAYRGAKEGTLWFLRAGVLWGESKPCEFWPLEALLSKADGLRVISATGRTCTVVLTRKSPPEERAELDEGEADPGVEAAFSNVDGREQEGINKWVREHRELFGKEMVAGVGALQVQDDSDEEDGDFEADSESDGGSASGGSSEEEDSGDESGSEEAEDSGGEHGGRGRGRRRAEARASPLDAPGGDATYVARRHRHGRCDGGGRTRGRYGRRRGRVRRLKDALTDDTGG
ncbi:histone chaperone Rttp106-like-domain-containing protein [Mycena rosella]|uniref:Histone chaperone Rttp106-like-domain-containing protein n=1 Tax=Mycena rosella TaxID=1033263 RepID=A0AAD7CTX8_MYCRO|nr:histone chaperone Rttp106-like-domain-containing protein [Mycena rosella]